MPVTINKLVTIERHISEQQILHASATGEFSRMMRDMLLAIRIISREVRRAGFNDILGMTESQNVHGEQVKKLDEFANETIIRAMDHGGHLCAMASEEAEGIIPIPEEYERGNYILLFDPLDGSSNIDVNVTIGTIFSVFRRVTPNRMGMGSAEDFLQPGDRQIAAGYACYGSSTNLVYTTGSGVNIFTLDPTVGEFFLTHENVRMPERGQSYSINEGNYHRWDANIQAYVDHLKKPGGKHDPYSLRYIGTAVADIHRILQHGGIFMYPADKDNTEGKLRLMYELNPLAMLIEQAGGRASNGSERILELRPEGIHQRTPVFMGSRIDVEEAEAFMRGERPPLAARQQSSNNGTVSEGGA